MQLIGDILTDVNTTLKGSGGNMDENPAGWNGGIILPYVVIGVLLLLLVRVARYINPGTPREKLMKKLLLAEAKRQIPSAMRSLGFRDCYPNAAIQVVESRPAARYTNHYVRLRDGFVEAAGLKWGRWGRPYFIIDFDRIATADGAEMRELIVRVSQFPEYRLASARFLEVWFSPSWIGSLIAPRHAARRCVARAVSRLPEIDRFLCTGVRGRYIKGPFALVHNDGQPSAAVSERSLGG